jgi:hypothetical protein
MSETIKSDDAHRSFPMPSVHPLIEGVDALWNRHSVLPESNHLFELLYERICANWSRNRELERWPTPEKNWVLRVAPEFTLDPTKRLEKQLQKQIAVCLESERWPPRRSH